MEPPWQTYPDIQPRSMGWRMGRGEAYLDDFNEWFSRKSEDDNKRYADEHPEPHGWDGFYARRGLNSLS